jgi:molybdate transport system permease protein
MNQFYLGQEEMRVIALSLKVSFWAVTGGLVPGVLVAWLLARREFWGKSLLDGLVHLPLVLPPVVTGYVLLIGLGRNGMIGKPLYHWTGFTFAFNWKGAALASAIMAFPLLVRAVRLSLEAVDKGLEDAARTLGAGPLRVFFTITLPLTGPGILAGMILSFARSLSEFGATITFVSNIPGMTQTIPLALYTQTQIPGGETGALRLCLISIIIALTALMASQILSRKLNRKVKGE